MQGISRGSGPRSRYGGRLGALAAISFCFLLLVMLSSNSASAAPDRLDDEVPDAAPSLPNGISASYGLSSLSLDGPQNSESTWHNYFKLRYQFSEDIGVRVFYNTHELAGGFGLLTPLYDVQDKASSYGFDLSMNMLNVEAKRPRRGEDKPFEAGSSFNIGVTGRQYNIDAADIGKSDQQLGAYLAYSTDLTEKMRAHTYFSTSRISGDSHTGSMNRVGAGLDYVIQRGRHPLVLMANGVLDIYNFRQPSFNTSRISRFDVGLRYRIRQGLYASAGVLTLNDSDNDASGSGIFAGLNYVDERPDYGDLGDPLPALPPPAPPPPPPVQPDPAAQPQPPPVQAAPSADAVDVLQAPLMASAPAQHSARRGEEAGGVEISSQTEQRSASNVSDEQARDATGATSGRPPALEQRAYTDSAMLDTGLFERMGGGAYFYDPLLAQENAEAAEAVPAARAEAGQDASSETAGGPVLAELADASGVAVPSFPLSKPQTSSALAMVRPPVQKLHAAGQTNNVLRTEVTINSEREGQSNLDADAMLADASARVAKPADSGRASNGLGLTPEEEERLARVLASSSGTDDDGQSVLVLQRERVLGPDFGAALDWPLLASAHVSVLDGGWVSYSNFAEGE